MLKYEDLPRLRELAEKATPGEWRWCQPGNQLISPEAGITLLRYVEFWNGNCKDFIAALNPATVIELLDMIERMYSKLDLVQQQADAGLELAQYASYAEIVGGVSHNRAAVRKWCDVVFEAYQAANAMGGEDE